MDKVLLIRLTDLGPLTLNVSHRSQDCVGEQLQFETLTEMGRLVLERNPKCQDLGSSRLYICGMLIASARPNIARKHGRLFTVVLAFLLSHICHLRLASFAHKGGGSESN